MPFCPNCRTEYEKDVDACSDCGSPLVENLPPENPDADPHVSLVEVYTAAGDQEALVVKGLLESEGIECSLSSDIPHSVVPLNIDGLGMVRISVSEDDAERAQQIISDHAEQSDEEENPSTST